MQSTLIQSRSERSELSRQSSFTLAAFAFVLLSAALASFAPLGFSIATVFLFAGPHNWVELRYFLSRLPSRFGPLKAFFVSSFFGVLTLGAANAALLWSMHQQLLSYDCAIFSFRLWIVGLFAWIAALILNRRLPWLSCAKNNNAFEFGSHKPPGWRRSRWLPAFLCFSHARDKAAALYWIIGLLGCGMFFSLWQPLWFGLFLVYLHPLVGLLILDRELKRSKPQWSCAYRAVLAFIPLILLLMFAQLSTTHSLATDTVLNQEISRHAGSFLLSNLSSHMLVSIHTFLEMIHYGVWIIAIPLATAAVSRRKWLPAKMPVAQKSRRVQLLIAYAFIASNVLVLALWGSFLADYSATRNFYFTVAVFHILAEIPFLLWLL